MKPISSELAGEYSLLVYGFVNTFGTVAGLAAPRVMGYILEGKNQGDPASWNNIFRISTILGGIGISTFILFGTTKQQPWAVRKIEEFDKNVIDLSCKKSVL